MLPFVRRLLLFLGVSLVVSSEITPVPLFEYRFPIRIGLYDPSGKLLHNFSVTTPMLLAAFHSLFCAKDVIVVNEMYDNVCPALEEERAPLFRSFILRSYGSYNGVETMSNGNFSWVLWTLGFAILQIPESLIQEAYYNYNTTNSTIASLEVAQDLQDRWQQAVNDGCTDSSFDGVLHANAVERNYRMYCSPPDMEDIPDRVFERWAALDASSGALGLGSTILLTMGCFFFGGWFVM